MHNVVHFFSSRVRGSFCVCITPAFTTNNMASRVTTCLFVNIVIVCMYSAVSGLFFHIGETEKKCFIEEIPDDTMVVGMYRLFIS